jgi:hypothetical protein
LKEDERRKNLKVLDEQKYQLAMSVAKQIPILIVSNAHFKGAPPFILVLSLKANWK